MKRYLTLFLAFIALLPSVQAAEEAEPFVWYSPINQELTVEFSEPLVSLTTVHNGRLADESSLSARDMGRDLFAITGDEKHKPIAHWSDQDELSIRFPVGTSCATEYTFQIKDGSTYLGGEPGADHAGEVPLPGG